MIASCDLCFSIWSSAPSWKHSIAKQNFRLMRYFVILCLTSRIHTLTLFCLREVCSKCDWVKVLLSLLIVSCFHSETRGRGTYTSFMFLSTMTSLIHTAYEETGAIKTTISDKKIWTMGVKSRLKSSNLIKFDFILFPKMFVFNGVLFGLY